MHFNEFASCSVRESSSPEKNIIRHPELQRSTLPSEKCWQGAKHLKKNYTRKRNIKCTQIIVLPKNLKKVIFIVGWPTYPSRSPTVRTIRRLVRLRGEESEMLYPRKGTGDLCWHQDFRDAMNDICHNSMKASIRAAVDALIEFSAFKVVGNDCKILLYSLRLLTAGTSLFCKRTDSLMHV